MIYILACIFAASILILLYAVNDISIMRDYWKSQFLLKADQYEEMKKLCDSACKSADQKGN